MLTSKFYRVDFIAGIISESIPINMVTIALLEKAKYSEGDGGKCHAWAERGVHGPCRPGL